MSAVIETIEDLERAINDLREDVDRIDEFEALLESNITGVFTKPSNLDDRLESKENRLDNQEEDVKLASAMSSKNKQGKIQKGVDVLEFGAEKQTHGMAGGATSTCEVQAAVNCSRSRAQSLMDEIAGTLNVAMTELPGGLHGKLSHIWFQDDELEISSIPYWTRWETPGR